MQYDLCRHIKTNGVQCQSPALAESQWCYFHSRLHQAAGSRFPSPACLLDRAGAGRPQRPWHRHRARHLQAGSRKPVGTSAWRPGAARSDAPGLSRMEGPHRGSKALSGSACDRCSSSGRRSARFSSDARYPRSEAYLTAASASYKGVLHIR